MVEQNYYEHGELPGRQSKLKDLSFSDYRISPITTTAKGSTAHPPPYYKNPEHLYDRPSPSKYQGTPQYPPPPPPPPPPPNSWDKPLRKPNLLEHFGFYTTIPSLNILKFCAIIILIILVELNLIINLESSEYLKELIGFQAIALMGIGIIGICIGLLYRYFEYEMEQIRLLNQQQRKVEFKNYIKVIFIVIILIFIILEVFVELINARGFLFLVDITSITIMAVGTYVVFSGKRHLIIIPILLIFIIMLLGADSGPDIPMMALLGVLTILYIELTDGTCRLQNYITRLTGLASSDDQHAVAQIDHNIDDLALKFSYNLGLVIVLTVIISGLLLLLYIAYPYLTPAFMSENLELQTVYAFLPIIFLLFFIFMIIYLFIPKQNRYNYTD